MRGTLHKFGLADSPPHPETSLRSVSDLSPQAGRGEMRFTPKYYARTAANPGTAAKPALLA